MRHRFFLMLPLVAAGTLAAMGISGRSLPPVTGAGPSRSAAPRSAIECSGGSVNHPLTIHVEALDPVRRGAIVRLRVSASSAIALERSVVRVVDAGGATVSGPREIALGSIAVEKPGAAEFAIDLPADATRSLVQFRVEGEGPAGRIGRGATFNLLTEGPSRPDRVVADAAGRPIAEYAARRIAR